MYIKSLFERFSLVFFIVQVDVNAPIFSHGTTFSPLMLAVKHQQDVMVRHLLMVRGINLSFRNSRLQSPVLFAVQNNNIDLVNLLLSTEESINNNRVTSRRKQLKDVHHPCAMLETIKHGKYYQHSYSTCFYTSSCFRIV